MFISAIMLYLIYFWNKKNFNLEFKLHEIFNQLMRAKARRLRRSMSVETEKFKSDSTFVFDQLFSDWKGFFASILKKSMQSQKLQYVANYLQDFIHKLTFYLSFLLGYLINLKFDSIIFLVFAILLWNHDHVLAL